MTGVLVACALVIAAIGLSRRLGLALERDLAVVTVRAGAQLLAVGAIVTLVFEHGGLAIGFVAVMLTAAAWTAGRRIAVVSRPVARAGAGIALGAATGLVPLLATGAFEASARELIPVAGILIGGAMAATSLAGRRLLDDLEGGLAEIEARLLLGASAQEALAPARRRAVSTGLIPVMDQTRTVGLVALPGTFVGLILGGADPAEAARVQLIVLLSLLAVELVAAVICVRLVASGCTRPGERVVRPEPGPGRRGA